MKVIKRLKEYHVTLTAGELELVHEVLTKAKQRQIDRVYAALAKDDFNLADCLIGEIIKVKRMAETLSAYVLPF